MKHRTRPYPHYKFPDEIQIEVRPMDAEDCKWHSVSVGSYSARCLNYGWFPTELLMGTDAKGRFADTNNIGAAVGANMGTGSIAVLNAEAAVNTLKAAGYNVIFN